MAETSQDYFHPFLKGYSITFLGEPTDMTSWETILCTARMDQAVNIPIGTKVQVPTVPRHDPSRDATPHYALFVGFSTFLISLSTYRV